MSARQQSFSLAVVARALASFPPVSSPVANNLPFQHHLQASHYRKNPACRERQPPLQHQHDVPSPSSSFLHRHHLLSGCQILDRSWRTAYLFLRTTPVSPPQHRPTSCKSFALCVYPPIRRTPTQQVLSAPRRWSRSLRGSSLSTPRPTSSQTTGSDWLQCLPRAKRGSSSRTNGQQATNYSNTSQASMLAGGERIHRVRLRDGAGA
jgi:hypothetical protein